MKSRINRKILLYAKRSDVKVEKTDDYTYVKNSMVLKVNKQTIRCNELIVGAEHIYCDDDWKIPIREIKNFFLVFFKKGG